MSAPIRHVLVCAPRTAGFEAPSRWTELGYLHEPRLEGALEGHRRLVEVLHQVGASVHELRRREGLSLDAIYAHDASFPTDAGVILMRMGKPTRSGEPAQHRHFFEELGVPILGAIEPPGTTEGGDLVWLDETTLLVGEGYRTNASGIKQLDALLAPRGIRVLSSSLPHGPGPAGCLHLMSLLSLLDERTALVDLPWLSVPTVQELERRRFELVPIEPSERETLAVNVLALGGRKLLALAENEKTNRRLMDAGFEVLTYPGVEISLNGSGGPTCLTRPFLRG